MAIVYWVPSNASKLQFARHKCIEQQNHGFRIRKYLLLRTMNSYNLGLVPSKWLTWGTNVKLWSKQRQDLLSPFFCSGRCHQDYNYTVNSSFSWCTWRHCTQKCSMVVDFCHTKSRMSPQSTLQETQSSIEPISPKILKSSAWAHARIGLIRCILTCSNFREWITGVEGL